MPDSGLGSGKHLRIGGQSKVMTYNRESDDAVLPDLSTQGNHPKSESRMLLTGHGGIAASVPYPTGSFHCLEYHIGADGTIETWLDGTVIPGLTVGGASANSHATIWGKAYKPKVTGVYFGWETYGGDANTVWFDDIAIASTRVGCLGK